MKQFIAGMKIINTIEKQLPPIDMQKSKVTSEVDFYGLSKYLAKKLQLGYWPISSCSFRHGWMHQEYRYIEEVTMGIPKSRYLVASTKEVDFFYKNNLKNVHAVGVPFIYIDKNDIKHIKKHSKTLLVMPPHSIPDSTHAWDEMGYINEIKAITNKFEAVVFCIHQSCIDKKLWIESLEKHKIPYLIGASAYDLNSLVRMSMIFRFFEYVTTNSFGSHVAYAAYHGCKVSIYGTYMQLEKKDFEHIEYYQKYPFLLDQLVDIFSYRYVKERYKNLFLEPWNAPIQKKWAKEVLGFKHKVSYERLAELLNWKISDFPRISFDFEHNFGKDIRNFIAFTNHIKMRYQKVLIYGAGTIGSVLAMILEESCIGFVDKQTLEFYAGHHVYKLEELKEINFDVILISNIGAYDEIQEFLETVLEVPKNKIIKFTISSCYSTE